MPDSQGTNDVIFLRGMVFEGRHGVSDEERAEPQAIEMDIEVGTDLGRAGLTDDLAQTVNYADIFEICRGHVEGRSYRLLESIAENIAADVLGRFAAVNDCTIAVRKPGVPIDGFLDHAGVRIMRRRG